MKKAEISVKLDTPNTQTIKNFKTVFDAVEYLLGHCTPDERLDLFSDYCKWCGTDQLPCYCNRDD
jgi:hypothetical protein